MTVLSDKQLSKKICIGNEPAFREIYDRYHVQMYFISKKYVKDHTLAEDAVQDIFLKLWDKRKDIDDQKSLNGFLFTMLRNHLLNLLRDRKKEIVSISEVNKEMLAGGGLADDDLLYHEYHEILNEGMSQLSDREREVFELRTLCNHSNSEVAKLLNINIRTVKTHYYLSSKFIKTYLKKHAGLLGLLLLLS